MNKAVVYCRISDDREGKGLGVARQEGDCRTLAAREGLDVVEVLSDNDRSAYSGRRRPGYEALLEGLKAGSWDVVLAWHPDRLHRSPTELEAFIDTIEAAGARVVTVQAGHVDLGTPTGRMTARVVGAVARHESEHKAERQRSKHAELARAGKSAGGGKAFGFEPDRLTIRESEAALIRDAARAVLDGTGIRTIANEWNQRGIPSTTGTRWSGTVMKRMLTSARIAGLREYEGRTYPAVWPAIVDHATLVRLRAVLDDPKRLTRTHTRAYLLTGGLAVCGVCGVALVARPKNGARSYWCAKGPGFHGCNRLGRRADRLEDDVVRRLIDYLERMPDVPIEDDDPVTGPLVAEVLRLEELVAQLDEDYYVAGRLGRDQYLAASEAQQSALRGARDALAAAERPAAPRDRREDLEMLLEDDVEVGRKRTVVAAWVEQVLVLPAVRGRNTYDRSRVKVRWK